MASKTRQVGERAQSPAHMMRSNIIQPNGALVETNLALGEPKRGKVRDTYDLSDRLLMVATDRISAFDAVSPTGVPEKGRVLTQLSRFWFKFTEGIVPNHLMEGSDVGDYVEDKSLRALLANRSMVVRKADVIPVECVVRGYLAGSASKEYNKTREICGIGLPEGLLEGSKLPEPIFTPTTKAESGHDMPMTLEQMSELVGHELATTLLLISLKLYTAAAEYALIKGIIIADTKFEFGRSRETGEILLIDEVLTPDSSRFWPLDQWKPGRPQPSFDKQYVRDYLETLKWDKKPPAPALPEEIVTNTTKKYIEAYERLTGRKWA
jgi:phosphoribosylaminoimidazole-succinocarboxamide synthase